MEEQLQKTEHTDYVLERRQKTRGMRENWTERSGGRGRDRDRARETETKTETVTDRQRQTERDSVS